MKAQETDDPVSSCNLSTGCHAEVDFKALLRRTKRASRSGLALLGRVSCAETGVLPTGAT